MLDTERTHDNDGVAVEELQRADDYGRLGQPSCYLSSNRHTNRYFTASR